MNNLPEEKNTPRKNVKAEPVKRPYSSPRILDFGYFAKLTQGTGSMNVDAVAGRRLN